MSTISEQVRQAIFEKANVSGVTDLATGGVHYKTIPSSDPGPFRHVVFDRIPGSVDYALGNNLVGERDLWMMQAIVEQDSSGTLEPAALGEAILAALETAIGGTLTISGRTVSIARRRNDIPPQITDQADRQIWKLGYLMDVYAG